MADKRRKKNNSVFMTVLVTILSLTVVTFFVVVCAFFASTVNDKQAESYVGSGVEGEIATESISVKINMENCMMTVGTKTQVTATIYPNGSSEGIIWTSGDENVFTIDKSGNLEVVGKGIVALTATFGTVSDSIAIECVELEEEAVMQLPNYSVFNQNTGNNSDNPGTPGNTTATSGSNNSVTTSAGNPGSGIQSSSVGNSTTSAGGTNVTGTMATRPTGSNTVATTTARPTNPATRPTASQKETTTAKRPSNIETTSYIIETTPPYEGVKVLSTELAGMLAGFGYKQYLDNTYVYEESDTFLGEVIISSNMTHIYIKERTTGFDNAINEVLKVLLPESNGNVWGMYTGASSDQTVTVDGRIVRVVVPAGDGHTQIVIYN